MQLTSGDRLRMLASLYVGLVFKGKGFEKGAQSYGSLRWFYGGQRALWRIQGHVSHCFVMDVGDSMVKKARFGENARLVWSDRIPV